MPDPKQTKSTPIDDHPREHIRHVHRLIARQSLRRRIGKFWHQLGPGLTTGASDDDPSGIATYSQAGSRYGYQLLWLAAFTFPLMAIVQEACARIGIVTGRGLAANIRMHLPRWVLYCCTGLLVIANTFNISADLAAMASAAELLHPAMTYGAVLVGFALITIALQLFIGYGAYARILKLLSLVLLAYVLTALTIKGTDWISIIRGITVPSMTLSSEQIVLICGILGTTISPYLFFWQTSQEVENEISKGKATIAARTHDADRRHMKIMRTDVWTGMLYANVVMLFIILTCASVLHSAGITTIQTAAQAAEALRPLAGNLTYLLFAVGIIGIGLLAIPVLAGSAAYALSESFRWKEGLYRKLKDAYAFYGVIAASIIVGLALNIMQLNPMKALFYSAVINGFAAPAIVACIMIISGRRGVMGKFSNGPTVRILGWSITVIMAVVAIASAASWLV